MPDGFDFRAAPWIQHPGVRLDHNGPLGVPFTPYDKRWFARPLIDVIGDIASRFPAQIAIDDGIHRLTYPQLHAMACRLSHAIALAGPSRGPVAINLPNDAFYLVAMLASLAAGRPCVLLSHDAPPEFNRKLIRKSGATVLVVPAALARDGSAAGGPRLVAVESAFLDRGNLAETPAGLLAPADPSFILSTSGSTGEPKLIVWPHDDIQRRAACRIDAGHYSERDRVLMLGAPATGSAISWRFIPLLSGATLHIVDVPRAGIGGIRRALSEHRITSMRGTLAVLKALARLDDAAERLASLRLMWGGGELLLQADLREIRAHLPRECFFAHTMSLTEAAVAQWFVPPADEHDELRAGAGYLVPGTDALVLDDNDRPCAPGELGELIVRGPSVALGEWIDGRVVADRFRSDPSEPGKRIYRTGDMVRLCDDGIVVVHGRKDRMVKIRGQRVEPAIIETAMRKTPGVADALVAPKQTDSSVRLYGFIVAEGAAREEQLVPAVYDSLATALPAYMRPAAIRVVPSLPTNASGKIDIKPLLALVEAEELALPAPPVQPSAESAIRPSASGASREMVADAWRSAFGGSPLSSSIGFDAAGGDSLQFMQIVFRLEQLSGLTLPLPALSGGLSQDDMARSLDALRADRTPVAALPSGKRVIFVPGLGGDEPRLVHLRAAVAPDLSILCVDQGDWTEWVEPGFSLEILLDRLKARIESEAPSGPLCLAGYSLGGQMILNIAARLHAEGRQIERVLLLDSNAFPPHRYKHDIGAVPAMPATRRGEFLEWLAARRRGEGAMALSSIIARRLVSPRWAPILRWLARHRRQVLRGRIDFFLSFHLRRFLLAQLAAAWRRGLRGIPPLPVPITHLRTCHPGEDERVDAGWRENFPTLTVEVIGGDHFTMFDPPHLADLCARIRAACSDVTNAEVPQPRRRNPARRAM